MSYVMCNYIWHMGSQNYELVLSQKSCPCRNFRQSLEAFCNEVSLEVALLLLLAPSTDKSEELLEFKTLFSLISMLCSRVWMAVTRVSFSEKSFLTKTSELTKCSICSVYFSICDLRICWLARIILSRLSISLRCCSRAAVIKEQDMSVINDPRGQTHSLAWFWSFETDGRTPHVKTVITLARSVN